MLCLVVVVVRVWVGAAESGCVIAGEAWGGDVDDEV